MAIHETYIQTSAPHIHSGDSVAGRNWLRALALLPVLVSAFWLGYPDFLGTALLGIACVFGFDWVAAGFFKRQSGLANGDTTVTAILLVLLLPAKCPAGAVMFSAFMTAVIANAFFGGLGSRLFHAAAFGCGALELVSPGSLAGPIVLCTVGASWISGAVALSAFLLIIQRQVYWEAWLYAAGIYSAGAFFFNFGQNPWVAAVFFGIFLFSDPSTLPLTRRGTNLVAIGAAMLVVLFENSVSMAAAMAYAVLIMNCVSPWFETWFKPTGPEASK